jgi:DNA-binding CsgD family transcriptional regulator
MKRRLHRDEPQARLEGQKGRHELRNPFLIGRGADNDLVLDDDEVSRRHAMIFLHASHWWLNDLGSRNGVRVNGLRLGHARRLRDGDELRIAGQKYSFSTEEEIPRSTIALGVTTRVTADPQASTMPGAVVCELIVASAEGEILEGEKAARWFFGKSLERVVGVEHSCLPAAVRQWLQRQAAQGKVGGAPLELQEPDRRVVINLCRCHEGRFFLLVREESEQAATERLQSLGLSPREAEVMHWICEGKTNPEIAQILRVTVHTANRHVEHILAKLGVDNRQKAIVAVMERMGG